ncbi:hypothetical protein IAG41_08935 [Sphingomonas sp. JC676]|uniref:hypothetical protein n=1 Tax=Sphingomonas sp. JC676 TaxID=2768065 RepID=UPI0016578EC8|nr:hypothetical protein [Sphingomonas sp. JC676]MBC9032514.1 hypothetical protein [Sphingomonas sp. JC676]
MRFPPLAYGAALGLVLALLIAPFAGTALGKLSVARAERDALAAAAKAPPGNVAVVAPGLAMPVQDAAAARASIMNRVQALAKAGGVLVEESSAVEVPSGLAMLRIRVSGAEKAVVALADALERGRPLIRLRSWQLVPIPGGVRLTGEAVAAWQ